MLAVVGAPSLDALIDEAIPPAIRRRDPLPLPPAEREHDYLARLWTVAAKNQVFRSFIGLGYYDTITPAVILRNVLENPGWYTPYTPYQAEIAQGRLESLLNFQTMVKDLTGMEVANASLLDEATAAAEAMTLLAPRACRSARRTRACSSSIARALPADARACCARAPSRSASSCASSTVDAPPSSAPRRLRRAAAVRRTTTALVRDLRAIIARAHDGGALVGGRHRSARAAR